MRVNKAQLSDLLGVSEVTLTEWQKESPPLPIAVAGRKRGQAHVYDTAVVIEWLLNRRLSKAGVSSPRDRLYDIQTEEASLRVAEKRGQLVNVATLEPELVRMVMVMRSRLLQLADRISAEARQLHDINLPRDWLEELVLEAMSAMSKYDPEARQVPADSEHASDHSSSATHAVDEAVA